MTDLYKWIKIIAVPALCIALMSAVPAPHTVLMAAAEEQPEQKAEYILKTDKTEYKDSDGTVRGIVSFQYPQFKGTSETIKSVNRKIEKKKKAFMNSENAQRIKEYTEQSIQNDRFWDETEQYFWEVFCNAAYNKNGIVSISMLQEWYAGGVHNTSVYGLNYNLNTGKKLSVRDVISGNVEKKILKALKKQFPEKEIDYDPSAVVKNRKNYKFYFTEGKVFLCFDAYELNQGGKGVIFTVNGKYK